MTDSGVMTAGGLEFEYTFTTSRVAVHATIDSPDMALEFYGSSPESRARLVCHVLVSLMPSEGLAETYGTLREYAEYYQDRLSGHAPAIEPHGPHLVGVVGDERDRPALTFEP